PFTAEETAFHCTEQLCVARHASGAVVARAADAAAAAQLCDVARLIVIDDATARNPCNEKAILVLTKRDLALRGSASVSFASGEAPRVSFAIGENPRIWHQQRQY